MSTGSDRSGNRFRVEPASGRIHLDSVVDADGRHHRRRASPGADGALPRQRRSRRKRRKVCRRFQRQRHVHHLEQPDVGRELRLLGPVFASQPRSAQLRLLVGGGGRGFDSGMLRSHDCLQIARQR